MFTEAENQRMQKAQQSAESRVNCIGTVLYVLGVTKAQRYVGAGEKSWEDGIVDDFLNRLTKTESPRKGAVLVIRSLFSRRVEHMGLVTADNPPRVYHRPGINAEIKPHEALESVIERYKQYPYVEFYVKQD
jgi:hypothetical protein